MFILNLFTDNGFDLFSAKIGNVRPTGSDYSSEHDPGRSRSSAHYNYGCGLVENLVLYHLSRLFRATLQAADWSERIVTAIVTLATNCNHNFFIQSKPRHEDDVRAVLSVVAMTIS